MKNRHCGFTLLELLISTAILCILLALAGSCYTRGQGILYCRRNPSRAIHTVSSLLKRRLWSPVRKSWFAQALMEQAVCKPPSGSMAG